MKRRDGRVSGFLLLPAGKEHHAALLDDDLAAAACDAEIEAAYAAFLAHNETFKQLCADWQLRPVGGVSRSPTTTPTPPTTPPSPSGSPPSSPTWPWWSTTWPAAMARFGPYTGRLDDAARRFIGGDPSALARPLARSYHDVWMELHEDFLVTLRRERTPPTATDSSTRLRWPRPLTTVGIREAGMRRTVGVGGGHWRWRTRGHAHGAGERPAGARAGPRPAADHRRRHGGGRRRLPVDRRAHATRDTFASAALRRLGRGPALGGDGGPLHHRRGANPVDYQVIIGLNQLPTVAADPAHTYTVTSFRTDPRWNPSSPTHPHDYDLAVIQLDRDVAGLPLDRRRPRRRRRRVGRRPDRHRGGLGHDRRRAASTSQNLRQATMPIVADAHLQERQRHLQRPVHPGAHAVRRVARRAGSTPARATRADRCS